MENTTRGIVCIAGIIAIFLLGVVVTCQLASVQRAQRITLLVISGADPIKAGCAVYGIDETNRETCRAAIKP